MKALVLLSDGTILAESDEAMTLGGSNQWAIDSGDAAWLDCPNGADPSCCDLTFNAGTPCLVLNSAKASARAMGLLRATRDALLSSCDWTQMPDSPLSPDAKAAWATYRQQLRTLPDQPGLDLNNPAWPIPPGGTSA